jgi:hypothetical protein
VEKVEAHIADAVKRRQVKWTRDLGPAG